jgi:ATP-dependent Clp protease ATP-binding subunit ClpC
LLGILREEECVAAEILHERGLHLNDIREELARVGKIIGGERGSQFPV